MTLNPRSIGTDIGSFASAEPAVMSQPQVVSRHSHATHAVRRGVDVFTLQSTLGHASSATTGHYVAANPEDSSSLRLG